MFKEFRGISPGAQFFFALFVVLTSFLFFMVVSIIVAIPIFDLSLGNLEAISDLSNPSNISMLKYLQTVQSFGLFIVPPIILAWLFHGNIAEYLLLHKKTSSSVLMLVILLTILISPSINFLGEFNSKMSFPSWMSGIENWMRNNEDNAAVLTEKFLDVSTINGLLFNLFMIALLPAIGEELLFRGVIQKIFINWTKSRHWGIWIAAILFSALHMQFYGFLPRLVLGVVFGYLLVWSGSMWLPILAHFVNNAVAVIAMWFVRQGRIDASVEEFGSSPESFYGVLISAAFSAFLIWYIRKQMSLKDNFSGT